MELSKDLDLNSYKRTSAAACYGAKPAAATCMISASGELICNQGVPFMDGAAEILGASKTGGKQYCGPAIEPFRNMEQCVDGSFAVNCALLDPK